MQQLIKSTNVAAAVWKFDKNFIVARLFENMDFT